MRNWMIFIKFGDHDFWQIGKRKALGFILANGLMGWEFGAGLSEDHVYALETEKASRSVGRWRKRNYNLDHSFGSNLLWIRIADPFGLIKKKVKKSIGRKAKKKSVREKKEEKDLDEEASCEWEVTPFDRYRQNVFARLADKDPTRALISKRSIFHQKIYFWHLKKILFTFDQEKCKFNANWTLIACVYSFNDRNNGRFRRNMSREAVRL